MVVDSDCWSFWALPVIAFAAAVLSILRGLDPRRHLLLGIHGALLAAAAFAIFQKSVATGLSEHEAIAAIILMPILGLGSPIQAGLLWALARGKEPSGPAWVFSVLFNPVALLAWLVMSAFRMREYRNKLALLVGLQLAAAELVLLLVAYWGFRGPSLV